MNRFMFGFCATILSTLLWPSLLPPTLAWCVVLGAIVVWRYSRFCAGSLLAMAWVSLFCYQLLVVKSGDNDTAISVKGEIVSFVYYDHERISANIHLLEDTSFNYPAKFMRLSWVTTTDVHPGEIWHFIIKPRSITSNLNQGGFNRQRYLLSRHVIGKGRVLAAEKLEETKGLRVRLISQIKQRLHRFANADLMLALMVGDRSLIDTDRWQNLRQSGTSHLIAISGLHLSVLALLLLGLTNWGLNRLRPTQGMGNRYLASLLALIGCYSYAWLAGFSLPTQRALIMLTLLIISTIMRRYSAHFERLLWALFVVLLIDPLSVMSAGFWLSFGAIAIILWCHQRSEPPSTKAVSNFLRGLGQLWGIQWRLSLSLGALQALLFGGVAPYSILFNLVFVPWFTLVVIPLTFVVLLLSLMANLVTGLLDEALALLNVVIAPLTMSFSLLKYLPDSWLPVPLSLVIAAVFSLLFAALWRFPLSKKWRLLSGLMLMPLALFILKPFLPIRTSAWQAHVIDVGQGLSVVVEKQHHVLIYDTGSAFGSFSYAKQAIIPFLQQRGINRVDYLILSHADNDHAGGASVLINQYPELHLLTDINRPKAISCRPKVFHWQGLTINVLAPEYKIKGNNGSCVVQIKDDRWQLLLAGDIESRGEKRLLSRLGDKAKLLLHSTVLIAPHHGSNTSSSVDFISTVAPKVVIYPAGFHNRWGFPKAAVVRRYQRANVTQYSISDNGQLSVLFSQDGVKINGYRDDIAPFWYNKLFQFGEFGNTE